jgi:hypothetical protein
MPIKYIKQYEATAYYPSTRSSHTNLFSFTKEHADQINTNLCSDGIELTTAEKLCALWTKKPKHREDIRYTYRVPTKEYL